MFTPLIFLIFVYFSHAREIWSEQQSWDWFNAQIPYIAGAEFTVSSAGNQLEMWQNDTFDVDLIDKELALTQQMGFNVQRIFLHEIPYFVDPQGFINRLNITLGILDKYGSKAMFVLFAYGPIGDPKAGRQPRPIPALCNSVYANAPEMSIFNNQSRWPELKPYVQDVIGAFANDPRVLSWDIWNEPANEPERTNLLYPMVYQWALDVNPTQPLTSPLWTGCTPGNAIMKLQVEYSDVISFHRYSDPSGFESCIQDLQKLGRPLICTEYLARTRDSEFMNILPIGKKYNIGMLAWGFVNGKTTWNYPWDSDKVSYVEYPPTIWFQDIFRNDRTPYLLEEMQIVKRLNGCPFGYHSKVDNWTCYNAYATQSSFPNAQQKCKDTWSDLATINNAFENADLKAYAFGNFSSCNSFYIGLSNSTSKFAWPVKTTGPWNQPAYRNWKSGYPTNSGSCVVLNKDGTWTNQDCSAPSCYICSY